MSYTRGAYHAALEAARRAKADSFYADYSRGKTLEEIGQAHGITRERVRQVITKYYGKVAATCGQSFKTKIFRDTAKKRRDARYIKRWGFDFAAYKKMRRYCAALGKKGVSRERQPLGAYGRQVQTAKFRGVAWEFNFAQWWKFWQDSGHWEERGVSGYVMCRYGDAGPYSPDNCYIATNRDNVRHYHERRHGNLTEFSTARAA